MDWSRGLSVLTFPSGEWGERLLPSSRDYLTWKCFAHAEQLSQCEASMLILCCAFREANGQRKHRKDPGLSREYHQGPHGAQHRAELEFRDLANMGRGDKPSPGLDSPRSGAFLRSKHFPSKVSGLSRFQVPQRYNVGQEMMWLHVAASDVPRDHNLVQSPLAQRSPPSAEFLLLCLGDTCNVPLNSDS